MNNMLILLFFAWGCSTAKNVHTQKTDTDISVEAEAYAKVERNSIRSWKHVRDTTASGGAYIFITPDTRVTHSDSLYNGVNFSNKPGQMCIVTYNVKFKTTGRYFVWVRAKSTGSEDNSVHVGIDGTWPETGARMQWCQGKNKWWWESKQRTQKEHCGVPYQIYINVDTPGLHTIQFSMREDGFKMDKFLLTTNRNFKPDN
jgi:hypothetical protein